MQNQQKYLEIIKNPYETDKATLSFLRKVNEKYPYCQSAQILLAKNLQQLFKPDFEQQVNKASAYAVNRRKFQRFISDRDKPDVITEKQSAATADFSDEKREQTDDRVSPPEEPVKETEQKSETKISPPADQVERPEQIFIPHDAENISDITVEKISDDSLSAKKDDEPEINQPAKNFVADEKKENLSLLEIVKKRLLEIQSKNQKPSQNGEKEKQTTEAEIKRKEPGVDNPVSENKTYLPHPFDPHVNQEEKPKHKIPDFIYGKQAKKPDINYLIDKFLKEEPRIKVQKELPDEQEDLSASSTEEDPQLATETLALVYLKQGKKEEALDVYEKLCLKFPEKSSYFAKKILDIKKEINP